MNGLRHGQEGRGRRLLQTLSPGVESYILTSFPGFPLAFISPAVEKARGSLGARLAIYKDATIGSVDC